MSKQILLVVFHDNFLPTQGALGNVVSIIYQDLTLEVRSLPPGQPFPEEWKPYSISKSQLLNYIFP